MLAPVPFAAAVRIVADIAAHLKTARLRRNLTAAQAAAQIGVSTPTLTRIETGDSLPSHTSTVAILRWLAKEV